MHPVEFERIVTEKWPGLSSEQAKLLLSFYRCVQDESQRQNLTKLLGPLEFWEGHVEDVRELLTSDILDFPAMDLGSGAGVPGLLAAILDPDASHTWVLAESEGRKAEFLRQTAAGLGMSKRVEVFSGRAEDFLRSRAVRSIVARAVGPVDRIYTWIRPCSTWNNLVLLKGPGWQEEWDRFQMGRHGGEIRIVRLIPYQTGAEKKSRCLVRLERVPRGTKKLLAGSDKGG